MAVTGAGLACTEVTAAWGRWLTATARRPTGLVAGFAFLVAVAALGFAGAGALTSLVGDLADLAALTGRATGFLAGFGFALSLGLAAAGLAADLLRAAAAGFFPVAPAGLRVFFAGLAAGRFEAEPVFFFALVFAMGVSVCN